MFVRGLRTKIAVTIAGLLLVGMFLIDLVTMVTLRRELIRSEISKANAFINLVEDKLLTSELEADGNIDSKSRLHLTKMINHSQITDALVIRGDGEQIYRGSLSVNLYHQMALLTKKAISSGNEITHITGTGWNIFSKKTNYLILSAPLTRNNTTIGGIGLLLPLDSLYQTLRKSQQVLFIYIFINLAILTTIGIYRISKLYLQPLARLAKRAEDYKDDDDILFSVRKEDNELNRLSKALNIMLKRISADKEMLRSTVLSLEKTNIELKKAQREIIRAEKLASVGRLSAGIAHEIGNPIGIVIGYLELLKQMDISDSERDEYIHRTEEEIERINRIIQQLLEISRPSKSSRTKVSVHELIQDTADVLRVQPLMAEIDLSLNLIAADDTVWADPNQLRQVFLNLIINAADAIADQEHDAGGRLEIATELEKDNESDVPTPSTRLKIMVMDNGPGIAEETMANIFDPFFTTKDPGRGTGLGLSVSFMIIESLNGRMTGVSEEGVGTKMVISLPLYENHPKNKEYGVPI